MRFHIGSPHGRGANGAACANADEVAAIVAALEIVISADRAGAREPDRAEPGSRWKRAGRSYGEDEALRLRVRDR